MGTLPTTGLSGLESLPHLIARPPFSSTQGGSFPPSCPWGRRRALGPEVPGPLVHLSSMKLSLSAPPPIPAPSRHFLMGPGEQGGDRQ